jgi:TRAP-type C4-dicarboxylate transport system permease small subunit
VLKNFFDHFEEMMGALVILVMVSLSFINVITRYIIVYPLAFTEEITISMFVWVTMLGVSIAFRNNANLAVTVFYDLVPRSCRKIFYFIANGLCIVFFLLLIWLGGRQVIDEWQIGAITDSLAIPACIYSAGIPVFSVLIVIRIVQAVAGAVRNDVY